MKNKIVLICLSTLMLIFTACSDGSNTPLEQIAFLNDSDGDFIPNDIEELLGKDSNNADEDADGVLDGLSSSTSSGDQFFDKQWHIHSLGTLVNNSGVATIVGNDLDVLDIYRSYMGYNKGDNIIIQVVDGGIDIKHEDLAINIDMSRSYDGEKVGDPKPVSGEEHGTAVAGIIASRAFNGVGVRGVIPFAKIAGSNIVDKLTALGLELAWFSGKGANEIAVSNNSWGDDYSDDTTEEKILQLGSDILRDGKGRIYVFAAGNNREEYGNANLSYVQNNRYAIVVGGLKHDNTFASYSAPGSNLLVTAHSGEYSEDAPTIATTTVEGQSINSGEIDDITTWSEDVKQNYIFTMNGTSASAPIVSASIGLVLEACPMLTWRDVKYLVAKNAKKIDPTNETWVKNSAGLSHSIDYGYGLINPKGMINECLSPNYKLLPMEQTQTLSKTFNIEIPDNNIEGVSFEMTMSEENLSVEWVEVTLDINSTYASDYNIVLISPHNTKTLLMQENNFVSKDKIKDWMDGGFRLSSAAMVDELSSGTWKVEIRDMNIMDIGTLKSIELDIYGHRR